MRQFLAVPLPDELRGSLTRLQEELRALGRGWRWIRADGLHITLRFLGEVEAELDGRARPQWRRAVESIPAFEAGLEGIGAFPPRGRPRVLWTAAHEIGSSGRFAALAELLEQAARGLGFRPEQRRFRAHVTLARARAGASATLPRELRFGPSDAFPVRGVTLYRSQLRSDGARYTALDMFPLAEMTCAPSDGGAAGERS